MKTTEVNESIIGKRCKCIFTSLMVTGVIEEINITKYTAEVKVRFDVNRTSGEMNSTNANGHTPDCTMSSDRSDIWKS